MFLKICSDWPVHHPPPDGLPDLVREFRKLRLRVAAFLEVEVRSVVDRIDHDLLAAPREKDEGEVAMPLPDLF